MLFVKDNVLRSLYQRAGHWLPIAGLPIAGMLWGRKQVLPIVTCLWFSLSLIVVAVAGSAAQRMLAPSVSNQARPPAGIFQRLWLGQYVLFGLVLAITPVISLLHGLTGVTVSLRVSLPLLVALLTFYRGGMKPLPWRAYVPELPTYSFPLAVLVGLALFRAISFHDAHAGALGHDPLQHIYWAQHISDYGFLPVTARNTDYIDAYPKYFHLLSAVWGAAGQAFTVGPFVKLMPFVQNALSCGFACELFCASRVQEKDDRTTLLSSFMGLLLCWHLTAGDGQSIYPSPDLAGTPRFAAAWLLFALPLLIMAHRIGTLDAGRILWAAPWVLASLTVGTNPVLFLVFATYSVPFSLLLWILTKNSFETARPSFWRASLLGVLGAGVGFLLNPFLLEIAGRVESVGAVLAKVGVRLQGAGLPVPAGPLPSRVCPNDPLGCLETVDYAVFRQGLTGLTDAFFTGRSPAIGPLNHSGVYIAAWCVPLVITALLSLRSAPLQILAARSRIVPALIFAALLPALLHPILAAVLNRISLASHLWWLLWSYFVPLHQFVAPCLVFLLAVVAWLVTPTVRVRPWLTASVRVLCVVAALFGLSLYRLPALAKSHYFTGTFKIDWPRLRAISHLNAFVPRNETVLIPARHRFMSKREHVLFSDNPTGVVVPHLTTRLLFGVNLGSGAEYGWPDLTERFCASEEARRALLREAGVRWVLVRARPGNPNVLKQKLWECDVTLTTLKAEYPPAWSEEDLALYRVNP